MRWDLRRLMSDYDAFGRRKDEAGLGDLGWGTTDDPDAPSGPHRTVSATASEGGLSSPSELTTVPMSPVPQRSGRRPLLALIRLAVLAAVAFGIYAAVDAGSDAVDDVRETFDQFGGAGAPGTAGDEGDRTVPDQVEARRLFTPAGLGDALRVMRRELPGKVGNLSIRRDRINATVVQGGRSLFVNFAADAEVPQVLSTSTATPTVGSFSYAELDPTAPARLIRASNARVDRAEADVDYVVAQKFSGQMQWGVYYKGGSPITQGDARGRYLRRISGPATASPR